MHAIHPLPRILFLQNPWVPSRPYQGWKQIRVINLAHKPHKMAKTKQTVRVVLSPKGNQIADLYRDLDQEERRKVLLILQGIDQASANNYKYSESKKQDETDATEEKEPLKKRQRG